jgi:glycosyltransferase involved in cell wall biosynthesis
MIPAMVSVLHLSTGKSLRGGERQVMLLHNGLLKKGIKSFLVCNAASELSKQNIARIQSVPWHGEADPFGLLRFYYHCKKAAPEKIHCHDAHALFHGSIIGALLGVPIVYTRRVLFSLHDNFISKWKYAHCEALITVSNAVAGQFDAYLPPEKIHVVHDGVDWNTPMLSRREARNALGVPENCRIIGAVGHFTREKNLPLVLKLAQALRDKYPHVKIVCIGPADFQTGSLPDNIVRAGYKTDAASYYSAFDLYISSSKREGLGSALIDAVVRNIPAIALDAGGTRDIFPEAWPLVPENTPGLFIAAVIQAIDNFETAKSDALICGKRARDIFSVDSMVDGTLRVYRQILRGKHAANGPAQRSNHNFQ